MRQLIGKKLSFLTLLSITLISLTGCTVKEKPVIKVVEKKVYVNKYLGVPKYLMLECPKDRALKTGATNEDVAKQSKYRKLALQSCSEIVEAIRAWSNSLESSNQPTDTLNKT